MVNAMSEWGIRHAADCKPDASNYDCVHDWEVTTGGATTEGCYVQLVCRKCGKQKQIFNSYENLVDIMM